jgi:hypothetical protein
VDEPELKIIDVFVCKLRKKLARANRRPPTTSRPFGAAATWCDPTPRRDRCRRPSPLTRPSHLISPDLTLVLPHRFVSNEPELLSDEVAFAYSKGAESEAWRPVRLD